MMPKLDQATLHLYNHLFIHRRADTILIHHPKILVVPRRFGVDRLIMKYGEKVMKVLLVSWIDTFATDSS